MKGSALNSAEHGNVTGVARPIFRHPIWNLAACPPLKSPIFALSHDPRMTGVVGLRRFAPNASWTPSMAMRRVQGQEAAMHSRRAVEYTTTSRARADGYAATRVLCSGAVRRRPAIPHCEDRQTCTRRQAAAITFSHDTLKVRENRVAGAAHEHPPSRLTGPARQLAVCPVRAGRSRQGGKAPRACRDAHSDRLAGAESRPLACMLACLLARICPPARWHPRPPAGMPDCPYARPPACLHVCPSRSPRRCRITSASSRRKTIELETKLAIAERETTKLEAKLKRAEAAVFKLRMEVADVLRATTPVLACMHPHLRSHARTHADMCSRTRARARSPYLHTPPLIHMHTHTLAR